MAVTWRPRRRALRHSSRARRADLSAVRDTAVSITTSVIILCVMDSENAGARDVVLDGGDSTTRPVLANVANVVAGSAPEATAVKPRSWNHKREGLILRQVVEEVLLTRESSRGRALAPNELSEEDLAWRRSSERRRITDAQWKQIVAKCKAKGFAEHHASAQFLKANKMTKIFDDLGIEKSLRAGSRPAELSVKALEMLLKMCPSAQDKEEQRKRALVRANCALEALIHREEDMENEFEIAQDVELDELGEWGQAAFAALNELRKDADKLDLELVDRERLRGLYQAMSALRDNILKACGASSWVRSAYEELASTHHSSPSQPSQSSSGRPSQGDSCANDRDDAVDTDEPQKKKRRTLGKGAGSDDAKVNHDCAVRWLRSRLERIARTTKEVSEIGMKLIRSRTRQMPQLSWFCVWHDGTSKRCALSIASLVCRVGSFAATPRHNQSIRRRFQNSSRRILVDARYRVWRAQWHHTCTNNCAPLTYH